MREERYLEHHPDVCGAALARQRGCEAAEANINDSQMPAWPLCAWLAQGERGERDGNCLCGSRDPLRARCPRSCPGANGASCFRAGASPLQEVRGRVPAVRLPLDEQPAHAGAPPSLHHPPVGHLPGELSPTAPGGPAHAPSCRAQPGPPAALALCPQASARGTSFSGVLVV